MANERPLRKEDFEASRFTCNASNLIEASLATDSTLTGTGSTANPLSVPDGTVCAALAACTLSNIGNVDATQSPADYNAVLARNNVTGTWEALDMNTAIDCSYFTGV